MQAWDAVRIEIINPIPLFTSLLLQALRDGFRIPSEGRIVFEVLDEDIGGCDSQIGGGRLQLLLADRAESVEVSGRQAEEKHVVT